jgi:hypothetical protein
VIDPVVWAWQHDHDALLVGTLLVYAVALVLLWGLFSGAILRLAAVDLSGDRREEGRDALAFARRHWRGFVGARLALWAGVVLPLLAAAAFAALSRLPEPFGGVLLVVAVVAALVAALVAVSVAAVVLAGGCLAGPTVACEDSDAFDAVARTFAFAGSGMPRLVGVRLFFASGVVLGSAFRLAKTVGAALLLWLCLSVGAGSAAMDRAFAILKEGGLPPDAARLGIAWTDVVVALALALVGGALAILWFADLVSRALCAHTAVYLWMRRAVDGTPVSELRTAARGSGHMTAEQAGFVEVSRVP